MLSKYRYVGIAVFDATNKYGLLQCNSLRWHMRRDIMCNIEDTLKMIESEKIKPYDIIEVETHLLRDFSAHPEYLVHMQRVPDSEKDDYDVERFREEFTVPTQIELTNILVH